MKVTELAAATCTEEPRQFQGCILSARDGGGGQSGWKAPRQSSQQEGSLHVLHGSEHLGHCGCLEKEAGDTAEDRSPYTTSGYHPQVLLLCPSEMLPARCPQPGTGPWWPPGASSPQDGPWHSLPTGPRWHAAEPSWPPTGLTQRRRKNSMSPCVGQTIPGTIQEARAAVEGSKVWIQARENPARPVTQAACIADLRAEPLKPSALPS